jgi:hypothetical protein
MKVYGNKRGMTKVLPMKAFGNRPSLSRIERAHQLQRETLPPVPDPKIKRYDLTDEDMFDCYANGLKAPER